MYYDLNIPWPVRVSSSNGSSGGSGNAAANNAAGSKKQQQQKAKQNSTPATGSNSRDGKLGADMLSPEDKLELEKNVKMAIKLGNSTIAFNVVLPPNAFDASTIGNYNPCYGHRPAFPELDTRTADVSKGQKTLLQLSRLTVVLDERSTSGGKGNGMLFTATNANSVAGYNILAALPLDATSFSQACLSLSGAGPTGIDIITLDLASSPRLPFQLKRSLVLKAIAEGTMFEVCYAPAMRLSSDPSNGGSGGSTSAGSGLPREARRNIIAGARELIRITNGKGIILSSMVKRALEMRSPLDLCNLGTILGFKPDQSKNSVSGNARLVVIRGHAARKSYRGVITNPEIVEVPPASAAVPQEPSSSTSATTPAAAAAATQQRDAIASSSSGLIDTQPPAPVAPATPSTSGQAPTSAGKRKRGAEDEGQKRKKAH